jgi:hypothetical protein
MKRSSLNALQSTMYNLRFVYRGALCTLNRNISFIRLQRSLIASRLDLRPEHSTAKGSSLELVLELGERDAGVYVRVIASLPACLFGRLIRPHLYDGQLRFGWHTPNSFGG